MPERHGMAAVLILLSAWQLQPSHANALQPRFRSIERPLMPSRTSRIQHQDHSRLDAGDHSMSKRRFKGTWQHNSARFRGSSGRSEVSRRRAFLGDQQEDPTSTEEREKQKRRENEFIVNKGKVIDTIREDLPNLFDKGPDLKLFREDVRLHICVQRLGLDTKITGKRAYRGWFDGLKWTSRAIFDASVVGTLSIGEFNQFKTVVNLPPLP